MRQHHVVVLIDGQAYRCRAQDCRQWGGLDWAVRHAVANQYKVRPDADGKRG